MDVVVTGDEVKRGKPEPLEFYNDERVWWAFVVPQVVHVFQTVYKEVGGQLRERDTGHLKKYQILIVHFCNNAIVVILEGKDHSF